MRCPMMKGKVDSAIYNGADEFLPCIQEECAWWVKERTIETEQIPGAFISVPAHCVILNINKL